MILPDFILPSRVNQRWQYSGIDCYKDCKDKKHFKEYPYAIEYQYNSRGFRDQEWPDSINELKNAVWCVGDSFTVGLGSPAEHAWPSLLQKQTGLRTINVSMDGASNHWIARKTVDILQQINPQYIVLHWSYFSRRENPDSLLDDEQRRLQYLPNEIDTRDSLTNFEYCVDWVEKNKSTSKILHSIIPNGCPGISLDQLNKDWANTGGTNWPVLPDSIEKIPEFIVDELKNLHQSWNIYEEYYYIKDFLTRTLSRVDSIGCIDQLDLARDGHHYDILTGKAFVSQIANWLNYKIRQ